MERRIPRAEPITAALKLGATKSSQRRIARRQAGRPDPVSHPMKVTHHRGGVLDARPLPALFGIEAAIFDRVGRVAQREVLRIRPGVRRLSLEFPGSGGSLDAYMTARSVVAWMHGGSPTVLRSTWRVPEGATARLDLCALAGKGVAELSLSKVDGGADEVGTLIADGQPIVRVLTAGLYTLRVWAFEGQAAVRAEFG